DIRLITVTSGEKNEAVRGTEPPSGDPAPVQEERIDLGRAARGAGSPVNRHYAGNDESTADHNPDADDANEHADDANEHADDANEHADDADEHADDADEHADDADEPTDDLDPDYLIHAPGKYELYLAADDHAAERDADVPAQDLQADDDGAGRDV